MNVALRGIYMHTLSNIRYRMSRLYIWFQRLTFMRISDPGEWWTDRRGHTKEWLRVGASMPKKEKRQYTSVAKRSRTEDIFCRTRKGREVYETIRRDTEGTCYALRDIAAACGIHNFVKTKMLRSCLGGATFFLVSRNVQLACCCSVCISVRIKTGR